MKKYRICLFLFLGVSLVCILIAFSVRRSRENSRSLGHTGNCNRKRNGTGNRDGRPDGRE